MVLLRYRFPPPMRVGRKTKLPSGREYRIPIFGNPVVDVDERDVEALLVFRGECCTGGRGKVPLFERAE